MRLQQDVRKRITLQLAITMFCVLEFVAGAKAQSPVTSGRVTTSRQSISTGTRAAFMKQEPIAVKHIRISGELQKRLELSHSYLLSKSTYIPADMGWGADQYARWIEAVALLGNYLGLQSSELDRVVREFISLQQPDGRILIKKMKVQEWWGATRALNGLMHYYNTVQRDPKILKAAQRFADFFLTHAPVESYPNAMIHANYHSALEGMVAIWRVTKNAKYLAFAERVALIIDPVVDPPGPAKLAHQPIMSVVKGYGPHQHHTHSYLEVMQGMADLYAGTGKEQYLEKAQSVWDQTLRHTMWVSGGIPEVYGEYFEHNDETCPVTSWMLLGLRLFRETGDAGYVDVVEHSLYNHLSFDQGALGGFYADRSVSSTERVYPDNRGSVADACCSMHGARGIYEILPFIFSTDSMGVNVNFFIDSTADVLVGKEPVQLRLNTGYPTSGQISLTVETIQAPREFEIRIRTPSWLSSPLLIRVNGETATHSQSRGYAVLKRMWRPNDQVDVSMKLDLRLVKSGENGFNAPRLSRIEPGGNVNNVFKEAALLRGPLVLMINRDRNPQLKGKNFRIRVIQKADGSFFLPQVTGAGKSSGAYDLPDAHLQADVQDDSLNWDSSWQKAILAPMSEMTNTALVPDDPYKVRNEVVLLPENSVRASSLNKKVELATSSK